MERSVIETGAVATQAASSSGRQSAGVNRMAACYPSLREPVHIVPFQPGHLKAFRPGARDAAIMAKWDFVNRVNDFSGTAASALRGPDVLAVAGITVTDGEGLAWIFAADELRSRPFLMHRAVKRMLRAALKEWSLSRIVAEVAADFATGHRWVLKLGFRPVEVFVDFTRYEMRS
jgi:RimJ/RimL family protein N-acetyltransferase